MRYLKSKRCDAVYKKNYDRGGVCGPCCDPNQIQLGFQPCTFVPQQTCPPQPAGGQTVPLIPNCGISKTGVPCGCAEESGKQCSP